MNTVRLCCRTSCKHCRTSCNTRRDGNLWQSPSPHQFIQQHHQPPRPLYFAASNHPSIHLLLSGALSNLPPLLKKSTGLIPSGYVCTGARYGAVEGDDFVGGAAKSNQLTALQFDTWFLAFLDGRWLPNCLHFLESTNPQSHNNHGVFKPSSSATPVCRLLAQWQSRVT
jgi:hypothetical protein